MNEKIRRIYIDTSVVNGAYAQKFGQDSKPFWTAVRSGEIIGIVSDLLKKELENAPKHVRDFIDSMPAARIEQIESTDESDKLAEHILLKKLLRNPVWMIANISPLQRLLTQTCL